MKKAQRPKAVALLAVRFLKDELRALEKHIKAVDPGTDILRLPGTATTIETLSREEGVLVLRRSSRPDPSARQPLLTKTEWSASCANVPFQMLVGALADSVKHNVERKVS